MARLTQADLVGINKSFEQRSPQDLIQWSREVFGNRLAAISSMQQAGNVVCHMLYSLKTDIKVLFVDTGVLFEETLQTRDRLIKEYGLDVVTLSPKLSMTEQTEQLGILYLTPEGQQECCEMRKTQPMLEAVGEYDALIGSLRRSDGGQRAKCPILAVDPKMNCVRINPLVNLTDEQLAEYIDQHEVILNPLHAQGYATIGCNRCTTPVLPNEPRRAGRWRHLGPWSVYCGINPSDLDPEKSPAIDLPSDLVDRVLGRPADYMI